MNHPLASVILPLYKEDAYLSEAINSILNQTLSDYELIVICDNPSQDTKRILENFRREDRRVSVIYQDQIGLIASLNLGLSLSRGKYIIRMDADDISRCDRFQIQVSIMERNPVIGICGSWVETIGNSRKQVWRYPINDATIRCELLFHSAFAHPATIIRRDILKKNSLEYSPTYIHAEDFALWVKASRFTDFFNIPQVLLQYRLHDRSVSRTHKEVQVESSDKVRVCQLRNLGIEPEKEQIELHRRISMMDIMPIPQQIDAIDEWLQLLLDANARMKIYPEPIFSGVIAHRWYAVCRKASTLGPWIWRRHQLSNIYRHHSLSIGEKWKFYAKTILNM